MDKLQKIAKPRDEKAIKKLEERKKFRSQCQDETFAGKWIYGGIFLDEKESNNLKKYVDEYFYERKICSIPIKQWKPYFSHCTLSFNNRDSLSAIYYEWMKKEIGTVVPLKVTEIGASNMAIAVKVEFSDFILCQNKLPHITCYVSPEGKPVMSNDITNWAKLEKPLKLWGNIDIFMRNTK